MHVHAGGVPAGGFVSVGSCSLPTAPSGMRGSNGGFDSSSRNSSSPPFTSRSALQYGHATRFAASGAFRSSMPLHWVQRACLSAVRFGEGLSSLSSKPSSFRVTKLPMYAST